MKAIEIIKGFCANWNDCENCDWVDVPEFEGEDFATLTVNLGGGIGERERRS